MVEPEAFLFPFVVDCFFVIVFADAFFEFLLADDLPPDALVLVAILAELSAALLLDLLVGLLPPTKSAAVGVVDDIENATI